MPRSGRRNAKRSEDSRPTSEPNIVLGLDMTNPRNWTALELREKLQSMGISVLFFRI
jgi:hypothetical protein